MKTVKPIWKTLSRLHNEQLMIEVLRAIFAWFWSLKDALWLARESHQQGLVVPSLLGVSWCDSNSASGILLCWVWDSCGIQESWCFSL